jgi:threonine dehydrogenase-like Zn-dependent dehydrogenase
MRSSRAAVIAGPERIDFVNIPHPDGYDDWGMIAVEACGLCGTDAEQYSGHFTGSMWGDQPLVPGHEVVGVIEQMSSGLAAQKFVVGDRIAIEPNIPCGRCAQCLNGTYVSCAGWPTRPFSHGFIPVSQAPSLWGGYAERMYLHPNTVVHRVPSSLTAGEASIFNAVATGFEWAVRAPQLTFGQTVLVLGAGQRGIASMSAAKAAGASAVGMTGTANDRQRLRVADELGADLALCIDDRDFENRLLEITDGTGFDVVVDTSAGAVQPLETAVRLVKDQGTVVMAGLKGGRRADIDVDQVVLKGITMMGVRSASYDAYEQALAHLCNEPRLRGLRTHVYSLDRVREAMQALVVAPPDRVYVGLDIQR